MVRVELQGCYCAVLFRRRQVVNATVELVDHAIDETFAFHTYPSEPWYHGATAASSRQRMFEQISQDETKGE